MKKNSIFAEKIKKLTEEDIDRVIDQHFENEVSVESNIEEAAEIAEKLMKLGLGGNLYPMDIWQFVSDTLDSMCERSLIDWFNPYYVEAMVPVMIRMIPESYEIFLAIIAALEKHQHRQSRQSSEFTKKSDILDSDFLQ